MSDIIEQKRSITAQLKDLNRDIKEQKSYKLFFVAIFVLLIFLGINVFYGAAYEDSLPTRIKYAQPSMVEMNGTLPISSITPQFLRKYLKEHPNGLVAVLPEEAGYVTLNTEADYHEVIRFLNNQP